MLVMVGLDLITSYVSYGSTEYSMIHTENCIDPCRHRDVPSVHIVEKWNTEED